MVRVILVMVMILASCSDEEPTKERGALQRCVWNQAYQENYEADTIEKIESEAEACYVLVDPFLMANPATSIAKIKERSNIVGCYISVGTCEMERDDFATMKSSCSEKPWPQWPDEYFVTSIDNNVKKYSSSKGNNRRIYYFGL